MRSAAGEAIQSLNLPGDGSFEPMFNGNDLTGWKGLVGNPVTRAAMTPKELAARQKEADRKMLENWSVRDGMIWFSGVGDNLCSVKEYGDFELYVDWKITREATAAFTSAGHRRYRYGIHPGPTLEHRWDREACTTTRRIPQCLSWLQITPRVNGIRSGFL